jgi:hypothetical protein
MILCTLISCWYTGNEEKKVAPFWFLKEVNFDLGDREQKNTEESIKHEKVNDIG